MGEDIEKRDKSLCENALWSIKMDGCPISAIITESLLPLLPSSPPHPSLSQTKYSLAKGGKA
jgi:hypothetical protein